ncbi:glycosyltransferase family 25 protein [Pseudotabrizicola sediminis]|uniref:Glycosyltransferase family 25 protein n=1 Tax=Pseudotabrizicola sediminis TaxID=2486418 RepID=A0ABY2KM18_9RHOB|nr:glycosyltransferase family 25 protein [Pseudotabrizicola sediminis]TGD42046.1 glycosyltransferase family 25 protein [Pseudotabrizicola sediminis]
MLTRADIGIWLINLPRDVARREAMETQLSAMGMTWQLFPAIDGRANEATLRKQADAEAYARNMGSALLPGKLGVYASHLAVWQQFLDGPHKVALVFEDDVVFHDDFLVALDTALAHADLWDLVRFNCIRAKLPVKQAQLGAYRLNAYIGPFTGNAAYLIHRDVAARLLPGLWPQTRALDHELNRFFRHNYRQLGLEPWASHPDDGGVSTITGTGFAGVKKFRWHRRLPHYRLKAANYMRRFWWLLRRGKVYR